jgi:Protein of unknown function (DUF3558)
MRTRILVAVVVVAATAGCTNTEVGQARFAGPSAPTGPPVTSDVPVSLPTHGAPKVVNPLNSEVFAQEPCRVLTPAQTKQLGVVSPGMQRQGVTGQDCSWRNSETGAGVGIQFDTVTKAGLSRAYELRDDFKYFIEIPSIEGYPGVAASGVDGRATGLCTLWVGIRDDLVFQVQGSLSTRKQSVADPCKATEIAASMAVKTMKGAA